MNGYQDISAGSQYDFDISRSSDYKPLDITYTRWQYSQNQLDQTRDYEQGPRDSYKQHPLPWSGNNDLEYHSFSHPHHLSGSNFASTVPSQRSSNYSTFSFPPRDSISSSISRYSHASDTSNGSRSTHADYLLDHASPARTSYNPTDGNEAFLSTALRKATRGPFSQEKDYFKTCVSASKQSRASSKKHKYFCTSCRRPFVEKADWKRHEETYQERQEMFRCDLCPAIYFLEKDFATHHVQSHRCAPCGDNTRCNKKAHVMSARKRRMTRTGWGCGFCCHFSSDWTERCNHIAYHVEKEGLTISKWYHSMVILSLLQRPDLCYEWIGLLRSAQPRITSCSWNQHSTGRVEGYPESNPTPQLQDYLEYFCPDQDAAALAQLAFDKMVKTNGPP
ncbi:Zinc finger C2H2 [Pyrenophora seminiperda CCB06]|uniref:Zinc finger C2H2 n=1 Tax=Pyrenophora seminiperda CCB06 TaxID=1302712 RepID=A0A3M7LVM0_9PLEO|nr:Zinc finger C2H2 [Pyrenophora seminiperda CCB06]